MTPIIMTTCTRRKRHDSSEDLRARNLPRGILEQTADRWQQLVEAAERPYLSTDLYSGRGFSEARKTAQEVNTDLYVISAGLGLVPAGQSIPAYDLTLSTGSEDGIHARIVEPIYDDDWWEALNDAQGNASPIGTLIRSNPGRPILMASPVSYLRMIAVDLSTLDSSELRFLRIFGPRDLDRLPEHLHPYVMPYGETFDGPQSPLPGTRSDFPQRVMRHFVQSVLPLSDVTDDPDHHRDTVVEISKDWTLPTQVTRQQRTDSEIIDLVPRMWERAKGSSGRMLRVLRDQELIACEQKRFATLFKIAKERHNLS